MGYFGLETLVSKRDLSDPLEHLNQRRASRFKIFKTKAFDIAGVSRSYDTELKMIFNLIEDYWHQGNQIDLVIESTLEICTSCRGYFAYLKMLAKSEGKTLNIKVISHPSATSVPDLNLLLS